MNSTANFTKKSAFILRTAIMPLLFFTVQSLVAQSPGGVSTNLSLWLKADAGVTGTSPITNWQDQSINNTAYTVAGGDVLTLNPVFSNFNPSVSFPGLLNGGLTTSLASALAISTGDVYVVFNSLGNDGSDSTLDKVSNILVDDNMGLSSETWNNTGFMGVVAYTTGSLSNPGDYASSTVAPSNVFSLVRYSVTAGGPVFDLMSDVGGVRSISTINTTTGSTDRYIPSLKIGDFFNGEISEIIAFDANLSTVDREKVESYLAIKSGITLDVAFDYKNSSGVSVFDMVQPYNKDVFGIANDVASGLDQQISKSANSTAVLTLENGGGDFTSANGSHTSLVNGRFLMIGNDGGATTTQTTELDLSTYAARTTREWRAQNTSAVGAVNLKFDGFDNTYVLLTDTDGDFSTTADQTNAGALNANGEITGTTLADGVHFTLATLVPPTLDYAVADPSSWNTAAATEANFWNSATYGNGKFVAVAGIGTNRVMHSPDGITWTAAAATEANFWQSVTYGNGKFVAVATSGTNRVMHSPDGITWTAAAAATANVWRSVTYGNGKFVAVASGGTNRVMHSPDGITWTAAAATEANSWQSVTFGGGKFVAVGGIGTNRVMHSPDGITWTAAAATEANFWQSVTFGGGKFVAVAINGTNRVMHSPDGITWTAEAAAEANGWRSVIFGRGKFVAVVNSGTNRVMHSPDGITWTAEAATEANGWQSVTYGNGKFVAVANGGTNRVMYTEPLTYPEVVANDGSLDSTAPLSITLSNDTFQDTDTDNILDVGTEVTLANVPAGLTPVMTLSAGDTVVTLTFTGNATAHQDANDVTDITFVFDNSAFTGGDASIVTNSGNGGAFSSKVGIDFEDNPAIVEFSSATAASTDESTLDNFPVLLVNGVLTSAASVDLVLFFPPGTATNGTATPDYTFTSPTTITIPAGTYDGTTGTAIALSSGATLADDTLVEGDETITFDLTNFVGATEGDANGDTAIAPTHTYTITDDDQIIVEFSEATYATDEATNITGNITVSGGNTTGGAAASIEVTLADGATNPATGGTDYDATTIVVTIPAADYTTAVDIPFTIPVTQDTDVEGDETIDLDFGTALGAIEGDADGDTTTIGTAVATITDDDISTSATGTQISVADGAGTSDGVDTETISVQLKDENGNDLATSGINVSFTVTGSASLSNATATTNASGLATVTISSLVAESVNVTATIDHDNDGVTTPEVAIVNGSPAQVAFTLDAATDTILTEVLEDSNSTGGANNANTTAVTAVQLAAINGIVNVVPANETAYQAAINAETGFSNLPTVPEVQAIIDAVNAAETASDSVLAQIGNEGDDPDATNSVVTTAQLNTITGITGVVPANQTEYQGYIDANPDSFSTPATLAEVQAMIDAVNDVTGIVTNSNVTISEGLTPNGDGINDGWVIQGIESYPNSIVTVYNRWGHKVFGATSYRNDWGGFYKDNSTRLPAGSYYYVVNLGDGSAPQNGWLFINY